MASGKAYRNSPSSLEVQGRLNLGAARFDCCVGAAAAKQLPLAKEAATEALYVLLPNRS